MGRELSLADGLVAAVAGRSRQLERVAALVDRAALERLLGEVYAAPVGRPELFSPSPPPAVEQIPQVCYAASAWSWLAANP